MQKFLLILVVGFMLVLSGCATLSESQCVASDWQTVGYRDGLAGTPTSQLLKHQNACVKHGVVPDRQAYLAGWGEGVEQYCQADNGFSVGQRGAAYNNICPDYMKDAFYAAYQDGRQLYQAQAEITNLSRQISQREYRVKQIKAQISTAEATLVGENTTTTERMELLNTTKELSQEQGTLETEIQDLKVNVALKSERLNSLRNTLAYNAY